MNEYTEVSIRELPWREPASEYEIDCYKKQMKIKKKLLISYMIFSLLIYFVPFILLVYLSTSISDILRNKGVWVLSSFLIYGIYRLIEYLTCKNKSICIMRLGKIDVSNRKTGFCEVDFYTDSPRKMIVKKINVESNILKDLIPGQKVLLVGCSGIKVYPL